MNDFKVLIEAVLDKTRLSKSFKDTQKFFNSQTIKVRPTLDRSILMKDFDKISKDFDKILFKKKVNIAKQVSTLVSNDFIKKTKYNTLYPKLDFINTQLQINTLNDSIKLALSQIESFDKKWYSLKKNLNLTVNFEQLITKSRSPFATIKLDDFSQKIETFKTKVPASKSESESWDNIVKNIFSESINRLNSSLFTKFAVQQTEKSITQLKEFDTLLTEIATSTTRTKDSLEKLGISAINNAIKYGTSANIYLSSVQDMTKAGFNDTHSEKLAELSLLAQAAGGMTASLANSYLIAADAAYSYHGDIEKLNALLDSQNQVTNRNIVSFSELAIATKVAATQLAGMGINENELTALLSAGIIASHKSGDAVGNAVSSIMMNLQQITGETGLGDIIDEKSLKRAEARCHSFGIELEYMKDGIIKLRDPIVVLKELADVYNSLPNGSVDKAGIIADVGGEYGGDVLSSILDNWNLYDNILSDYSNAKGSALEDAMAVANSWEGLLQQFTNNWTGFIQSFVTDDFITGALTTINKITLTVKELSQAFGGIPILATGAAIFKFVKNFG